MLNLTRIKAERLKRLFGKFLLLVQGFRGLGPITDARHSIHNAPD